MKKTEILIVSGSSDRTTTLKAIHNNSEWNHTQVATDEEAIEKFNRQNFDVAVIDGEISDEVRNKLRAIFGVFDPSVIILTFNNETENVANEIADALKARDQKNRSFVINDDAFKGYRLN